MPVTRVSFVTHTYRRTKADKRRLAQNDRQTERENESEKESGRGFKPKKSGIEGFWGGDTRTDRSLYKSAVSSPLIGEP